MTRKAFTLIELFVVITVISLVVILLMCAVQQARQAAIKTSKRYQEASDLQYEDLVELSNTKPYLNTMIKSVLDDGFLTVAEYEYIKNFKEDLAEVNEETEKQQKWKKFAEELE